MSEKVAIQGIKGSFHYQTAESYFGKDIEVLECRTFDAVVKALLKGDAEWGVMAIENSIAGAILPNYALIDRHNLHYRRTLYEHTAPPDGARRATLGGYY